MAVEVWDFTGFEAGDLGEFRPALVSNVALSTVAPRHGAYAGRLNLGASVTGFLKFEPLPFPH